MDIPNMSPIMGIDPGFRTGCKIVCLDQQGKLLHHNTIYPHMSEKKAFAETGKIKSLCEDKTLDGSACRACENRSKIKE